MEGLTARGNSPGIPSPQQWRCERSINVGNGDEWEVDSSALLWNCITGEVPLAAVSMGHCMILAVLLHSTDEWKQRTLSDKRNK